MAEKFSYEKAVLEIEKIIEEIETDTIDIDKVSEKVKKATALIKKCKNKLTSTQKEVDDLLAEME